MRISDWSSDVCSSDLPVRRSRTMNEETNVRRAGSALEADVVRDALALYEPPFTFDHGYIYDAKDRMVMDAHRRTNEAGHTDRKRVVEGQSVSVRVDLGGRRILKKKTKKNKRQT